MCKAESLLFDNNNAYASYNFSVHDIPLVHSPHSAATAAPSLVVIFLILFLLYIPIVTAVFVVHLHVQKHLLSCFPQFV